MRKVLVLFAGLVAVPVEAQVPTVRPFGAWNEEPPSDTFYVTVSEVSGSRFLHGQISEWLIDELARPAHLPRHVEQYSDIDDCGDCDLDFTWLIGNYRGLPEMDMTVIALRFTSGTTGYSCLLHGTDIWNGKHGELTVNDPDVEDLRKAGYRWVASRYCVEDGGVAYYPDEVWLIKRSNNGD